MKDSLEYRLKCDGYVEGCTEKRRRIELVYDTSIGNITCMVKSLNPDKLKEMVTEFFKPIKHIDIIKQLYKKYNINRQKYLASSSSFQNFDDALAELTHKLYEGEYYHTPNSFVSILYNLELHRFQTFVSPSSSFQDSNVYSSVANSLFSRSNIFPLRCIRWLLKGLLQLELRK